MLTLPGEATQENFEIQNLTVFRVLRSHLAHSDSEQICSLCTWNVQHAKIPQKGQYYRGKVFFLTRFSHLEGLKGAGGEMVALHEVQLLQL